MKLGTNSAQRHGIGAKTMLRDTTGSSLYHHAMGRAFKVVALADTDEEANTHMERTPGASVIDCYAGLVIMADKEDKGRAL